MAFQIVWLYDYFKTSYRSASSKRENGLLLANSNLYNGFAQDNCKRFDRRGNIVNFCGSGYKW